MREETNAMLECAVLAENISHLPYLYWPGAVRANFITILRS